MPKAKPPEERPNAETPWSALAEPLTPADRFFVRSHFGVPRIDPLRWRLRVEGAVRRPLELDLEALQALGAQEATVTLECAGNGRSLLKPTPPGLPWGLGAVGTARFTGLPLEALLRRAGLEPGAREVAFFGADQGEVEGGGVEAYARSLPLEEALRPEVLLAWGMNGAPLPPEHGFPLRLVVPGWYGMASVKWLVRILVLRAPFKGYFQAQDYLYQSPGGRVEPVTRIRVRALILTPVQGARLEGGPVEVRGLAWSGYGPVRRVEVSADGGRRWQEAELWASSPYAAARWRYLWHPPAPGVYTLMARAQDASGAIQPLEPFWNERGYGNNQVHRVQVEVC